MLRHYYNQFKKFKSFLGKEVWFLFISSIFIGVLWFIVESSFIFVLQGFLRSIGIFAQEATYLPSFYPTSQTASILLLLCFGLLRSLAIMLKQYFSEVTNQAFVRTQRTRIIEYALSQTADVSIHTTFNIFTEKVSQSASVIQLLTYLINSAVASFLFFVLGLSLAPYELVIGILLLFAFYLPLNFINSKIVSYGKRFSIESVAIAKIMMMGLRNHFLLKIYDLTKVEIKRGQDTAKRYEDTFKQFILISSIKAAFPQLAGAVVVSVISYVSLIYIKTPGIKLISFIYIFMRLAQGLGEASGTISSIRFNLSNFKELYTWHKLCEEFFSNKKNDESLTDDTDVRANLDSNFSIEVKDLYFNHEKNRELFHGLSFELQKGDILLLKGKSGCGKSTLLTLILGLQKPIKGNIKINGYESFNLRRHLAPHISYVGPEPFLNGGTYRENLLYGNSNQEIKESDLFEALRNAQIFDVVKESEKGLDQELKEVTELSTGQKQRLAIARALLRKPKLLILDEATANLDTATETDIIKVIKKLSEEMTCIIISHKDSFDSIANHTIDLNKIPRN